jgi:hypothetical protein
VTLDESEASNIRFKISVTRDGREVKGLSARGIFGEEKDHACKREGAVS